MKNLKDIISEKLIINKNTKIQNFNYHPKDRDELIEIINSLMKERGNNANLNDIDTSDITDMSKLFEYSEFNGDISKWDVSNVITMEGMFRRSKFTGKNGNISGWDVKNVKDMYDMFAWTDFNQDISDWDVKKR